MRRGNSERNSKGASGVVKTLLVKSVDFVVVEGKRENECEDATTKTLCEDTFTSLIEFELSRVSFRASFDENFTLPPSVVGFFRLFSLALVLSVFGREEVSLPLG